MSIKQRHNHATEFHARTELLTTDNSTAPCYDHNSEKTQAICTKDNRVPVVFPKRFAP